MWTHLPEQSSGVNRAAAHLGYVYATPSRDLMLGLTRKVPDRCELLIALDVGATTACGGDDDGGRERCKRR